MNNYKMVSSMKISVTQGDFEALTGHYFHCLF